MARMRCNTRLSQSRPPCTQADRKSTRLNSSHLVISYAVFCLKKKKEFEHFDEAPKTSTKAGVGRRFVARGASGGAEGFEVRHGQHNIMDFRYGIHLDLPNLG